jgi:transposase
MNVSYREITEKTGVPSSTALDLVKHNENHNTSKPLPGRGRKSTIDDRTRRRVLAYILENREEDWGTVARTLGVVSSWKVKTIAHKAGIHRCVKVEKPGLTEKQKLARLEWAYENEGRDWNAVAYTDESSVELGKQPKKERVSRRAGEEYLPECIKPTWHSGRKSIMVWAAISHVKKGPLIILDFTEIPAKDTKDGSTKIVKGLDAPRYIEQVVNGPLKTFKDELESKLGKPILVVEDGAPSHRAKLTKAARAKAGIKNLKHPAQSPDLNPLEPVWFLFKVRVARIVGRNRTLDNLRRACLQVWDEITLEEIQKHTGKMEHRVADLMWGSGNSIPY